MRDKRIWRKQNSKPQSWSLRPSTFHAQEADAAFRISAERLKELRSWFDWAVRRYLMTYCSDGRELSEAAGRKYALLYSQKMGGGPYDARLLDRLEEAATARWLAKWRSQSHTVSSVSSKEETQVPSQWQWWGWTTGASSGPEAEADLPEVRSAWMERADESDEVPSVKAFLDEVTANEPLPELATPTRLEIDMLIPQYTALCTASGAKGFLSLVAHLSHFITFLPAPASGSIVLGQVAC